MSSRGNRKRRGCKSSIRGYSKQAFALERPARADIVDEAAGQAPVAQDDVVAGVLAQVADLGGSRLARQRHRGDHEARHCGEPGVREASMPHMSGWTNETWAQFSPLSRVSFTPERQPA